MKVKNIRELLRISVREPGFWLSGIAVQKTLATEQRGQRASLRAARALLMFVALAPTLLLNGCAGLVSGTTTTPPPPTTLQISNVLVGSPTTTSVQVSWTTNEPATSSVDYGTTTSYGASTPVDSTMVTNHQATLSGLSAATTYYFQVDSTDSSNRHGHNGGPPFKTQGFSISGSITPAAGGSGATVALSGAATATATADSTGAYAFSGLPSGAYSITPNGKGYTYTPAMQSVNITNGNMTGVNFSDAASPVAPSITTQPANQTVTAGQTATFSVVAGGTAPLTYQWQKNGVNIAGATSTSYTTPATATTDSGSTFDVVVSNSVGSVTSSAATLTVNAAPVAPSITAQPTSQTVTAGQTATFSVVAGGTAPLTYQWQKNGVNVAGATGTSYTTPATATVDSGSTFDVVVSNSIGNITSSAATLTVNPGQVAPSITTQPANVTVTAGQTATFSVVAGGTAPLTYQWQKSGVNIAGATGTNYTTQATATTDSGSTFDVVVSNSVGSVTSSAATLTVNVAPVAPSITTQPTSQTVTAGQTATFSVVAGGTAPLTYQWQKNGVNIAGATGTSYTTPTTATTDSGSTFLVVVSNSAGSKTSSAATLTVNAAPVAPSIATQPANVTVTAGQTATFSVVAGGTAPLTYQWQKNGVNIAGATGTSYTTPATATTDSGATFDVVVSNSVGNITSSAATLTVNAAPAPAIQLNSTAVTFTNGIVGTTTSQALIITNTGNATLNITQVNVTGAAFSASGYTLPLNISAGQNATITVAFAPTATGAASGNISIVSNAPTSPTAVSLTGTGIAPTFTLSINPTSVTFGNVTTGTTSAAQTVTITSTGNSSVAISQISLNGTGYAMTGGSAPVTLSPNTSITLSLTFAPTVAGSVSGSISIVSNATGSPATVTLTGTGVAPVQHSATLSWTASTSTVAGYNIYRSTVSGSGYVLMNTSLVTALTYTDLSVQSATTYYYVTTAVDGSGNESTYSNEVSATIP